jgi:hypothetical protein
MGRSSRPERHPRHLPDTPSDSNLSRSPSAASKAINGDEYISQPPRTYRPPGCRVERSHDSRSRQHESRLSRIKPRKHDQTSYPCGGTYWDDSIGLPVFSKHHKRQSERLPGNGDRIFFTVGIDTERHFRRASLTLPKPPGEAIFSTSRRPRVLQEASTQKTSGRHTRPHIPRTDENDTHVRTDHSNGARRDPRERTSEGAKKRSNRGQENSIRPELTVENVTLNARRASPSNHPDVRDVPTGRPFTAQATARRTRASGSEPKSRDLPSNEVPIQKTEDSRGGPNRSSRRVDTYTTRDHSDRVSRGRRMERKNRETVPFTVIDDREETAAYRPRSLTSDPSLDQFIVDRRVKPTHSKRRSGNGNPPTTKETRHEFGPSGTSRNTNYRSHYEGRRTVRKGRPQDHSCGCTVS